MRINRVLLIVVFAVQAPLLWGDTATGKRGMVASVHPLATDVGVEALKAGGNAIDAAVATALTLGVVDGHNSGIGGGCFMLIRLADGRTVALDGREMAPAAATRDMFVRDGKGDTELSQIGALASGVPGSVAVYAHAVEKYGKRKLADALLPAAKIAEVGFPIDLRYGAKLKATGKDIGRFESTRSILLKPDGQPYAEGETLVQKDLARTYQAIAKEGPDYFYRGEFARAVEQWMKQNGGILTAEDFASYQMKQRGPLVTQYRGYTILGFPPPSSGGVHVAQIFNILEHFDLASFEKQDVSLRPHVMIEAMKLAFADRAHWLGDPDFVKVPRGLVNAKYGAELAKKISLDRASDNVAHGTPYNADEEYFGKHTTHIAAADAEGNWVAITTTVNTAFGSKVIIPGTGVIMNNQMDDFSIQPGVPNAFGLVGSDANAVAPKKRPLSSMSPTIVLKGDRPVLTVGAAGGPKIITQVLLCITNVIDLHDDLDAALVRPRFHHQWSPEEVWIERTAPIDVTKGLEARGHKLDRAIPTGATNAILRREDGTFIGVSEPRVPGKAAGY